MALGQGTAQGTAWHGMGSDQRTTIVAREKMKTLSEISVPNFLPLGVFLGWINTVAPGRLFTCLAQSSNDDAEVH